MARHIWLDKPPSQAPFWAQSRFGRQSTETDCEVVALAAAAAVAGSLLLRQPASCEEPGTAPGVWVHQVGSNQPCEDRVCVRKSLGLLSAAVFDGHGGWEMAEWISKQLFPEVERRLTAVQPESPDLHSPEAVLAALKASFVDCDTRLLQEVDNNNTGEALGGFVKGLGQGACALCAVVSPTHLLFANAGDCCACVIRDGEPILVHAIHNANQPAEQKRLRDAHPGEADIVVCWGSDGFWTEQQMLEVAQEGSLPSSCYVKDCVQTTRAFGDFYLKDSRFNWVGMVKNPVSLPYVTVDPEVVAIERCPKDEVVVLGSDGLWDELKGPDVACIVRETMANHCQAQTTPSKMAKLVAEALVDGATDAAARACGLSKVELQDMPPGKRRRTLVDDITCIVIVL